MLYRILDTFHNSIYENKNIKPQYVYSNDHCFGENDFEKLFNFINWCKTHNANMIDLEIVSILENYNEKSN